MWVRLMNEGCRHRSRQVAPWVGKASYGLQQSQLLTRQHGPIALNRPALHAGFPAGSAAALGAWTVLREVAAQDPSAPRWQFLQERWTAVKAHAAGHAGRHASGEEAGVTDEAASLLLVISHTTAGFPKEQAEELAAELLQVRGGGPSARHARQHSWGADVSHAAHLLHTA